MTIGRETHRVPDPFLVMATQNPIESEGTYPLPEAQVDRFMLKVLVSYPSPTEEFVIVERMTGGLETVRTVLDHRRAARSSSARATAVYVDPALIEYAVRLVTATREPRLARARRHRALRAVRRQPPCRDQPHPRGRGRCAFLRGRDYALPEDVRDLALDVMRHRLVLSYEALADGVTPDELLHQVMLAVSLPEVPLA